MQNYIKHQF